MSKQEKIPWKAYFYRSFWNPQEKTPGQELRLNREFWWGDQRWLVPSVYLCEEGIVVDLCMRAEAVEIKAFLDKWNLWEKQDRNDFTPEEQEEIEREHPLAAEFDSALVVNGQPTKGCGGEARSWIPGLSEDSGRVILDHYGLDPSFGWRICRQVFQWEGERPTELHSLALTMEQSEARFSGSHFRVEKAGDRITFTHPVTGREHTLTVEDYGTSETPHSNGNYEYPPHSKLLLYTIEPDLPREELELHDCVNSDMPRKRENADSAGRIGVPVAYILGTDLRKKNLRAASSASHFEPAEDVEWRLVFRLKTKEDITIKLL